MPDGMERGINILAVDDDKDTLQVLRSILTAHGYEVRFAENGEQWFGDMIGDRTQSFPESGCQNKNRKVHVSCIVRKK